jgi:hypothetical protein
MAVYGRRAGLFADPRVLDVYLANVGAASVAAFVVSALSRYLAPERRPELVRMLCYAATFLASTVPLLHRLWLLLWAANDDADSNSNSNSSALERAALAAWLWWFAGALAAAGCLGSFFPERVWPGVGDLLWRSHHASHLLAAGSAYAQFRALALDHAAAAAAGAVSDADAAHAMHAAAAVLTVALPAMIVAAVAMAAYNFTSLAEPADDDDNDGQSPVAAVAPTAAAPVATVKPAAPSAGVVTSPVRRSARLSAGPATPGRLRDA